MIISGDSISPTSGSNITIGGTNIVVPNGVGINVSGNRIGTIGSDYGAFKGNVVQCKITRYDTRTTVTTGSGGTAVEITGLRVSITPKFSTSMILCMFQIFGEGATTHNWGMRVFKDGVTPAGNYPAYNSVVGNTTYSNIAMAVPYESDYDSTPFQSVFYYHDFPNTTNSINYGPAVGNTDGGSSYVYHINKSVSNTVSTAYDAGISFSIAWEIAQ